jgi:photosystem II stability/assembly factor-like uncharacterized protein
MWDRIPEAIKQTKPYQRFEWFYKQRVFPYDTIPKTHYLNVIRAEKEKIERNINKGSSFLQWSSLGPDGAARSSGSGWYWGVLSGRVRGLAIHPTDPLTVYIGAASGGIWKTTNGGESWEELGSDLASLTHGAIAIDPNNPEIIYAGSGEACYFLIPINYYSGRGLFKSINGGQTWDNITNGFGTNTHFGDLEVSPHNSDIVIGSLASGEFHLGSTLSSEGIWKSTDAGINWTRTLDFQDTYDIVFHPTNDSIVYASIGGMNLNSGFYISTDRGDTWTQSNSGLQAAGTIARMQIDISQSNPDTLYAVIFEASNFLNGITRAYKSSDGGNSWAQISVGIPLGGKNNNGSWRDQGWYDLCITVNPIDPDHVLLGNVELHETINGADFYPRRNIYGNDARFSIAHVDYHKLVFSKSNPNYFYIGGDGGVYKSTNAGDSVSSINQGLRTFQFYRVASHPYDPSVLVGGTQDNGIMITTDYGLNWDIKGISDYWDTFFDYDNPLRIYITAINGNLFRSTNGGLSFQYIYTVSGQVFAPFIQHPTKPNYLYTANTSIIRSTNGGISFSIIAFNVSPSFIGPIAISKVNPNNMIFAAGTSVLGDTLVTLKISTDEGFTWSSNLAGNIPGEQRWIGKVVTDPLDENTMYALRTGFSDSNKVFKTTDLGQTWTNISGDLPDLPCNDLFVDPECPGFLYVANDIGVYRSEDGGGTWFYASEGIPHLPIIDFDYVKIDSTRYLRVATYGHSIYETTLDCMITSNESDETSNTTPILTFELAQNYPNPFNPITVIKYSIPKESDVRLEILNVLGEQVELLVNETKVTGTYEAVWNSGDLASGIYFYRIKSGNYIETKKMILIK